LLIQVVFFFVTEKSMTLKGTKDPDSHSHTLIIGGMRGTENNH